jgi:hypothetical protein
LGNGKRAPRVGTSEEGLILPSVRRCGFAGGDIDSDLTRHLQRHACCPDRKKADIEPRRYARPAVNLTEDRAPLVSINAGCSKKLGGALAAVDDLGALL